MLAFLYPFLALGDLTFTLLALFLAPIVAAFADSAGNLPRCLKWFQTFDASLDAGWKDGYFVFAGRTSSETVPTGLELWWLRTRWLYRNPGYGFSYWVLGQAFDRSAWRVTRNDIDASTGKTLWIARGPRGAFNINYLGRWGNAKLGWKAWNYWDGAAWKTAPWGPVWRTPICFTYTPFKRA